MRNRIMLFFVAIIMTMVIAPIGSASAGGGATISAPGFKDMAYDDGKGQLYYLLDGSVMSYDPFFGATQTVTAVVGTPKNIAIAPSGMVYVTDESYDTTSAWIWEVDTTTGVSAKISYPLTLGEGGSYDVAVDKNGKIYVSSVGTDIDARTPIRTYDTSAGWEIRETKRSAILSASSDGNFVAYAEKNPLLWYGGAEFGYFSLDGIVHHGSSMPDDHTDVVISKSHNMAMASESGVSLYAFNGDYYSVKTLTTETPSAVSFDASESLYVALAESTAIVVYAPTGPVEEGDPTVFVKTGEIDSGVSIPHESVMELSEDGKMIFLGTSDNIYVIGNTLSEVITPPPANRPPIADTQSVSTTLDNSVEITLTGSDPDGDILLFGIIEQPTHGTLTGTGPSRVYIPNPGYIGEDAFWFVVEDDQYFSVARVSIIVTPLPGGVIIAPAPNKAPSFRLSKKRLVVKTEGSVRMRVFKRFVKDINPGDGESTQKVRFEVKVRKRDRKFFLKKPAINAAGRLIFKLKPGVEGRAVATVVAIDNGGTDNGGVNRSAPQKFAIVLKK